MKESIDLTENRSFRGSPVVSPRKYKHKCIPWKNKPSNVSTQSFSITFNATDELDTVTFWNEPVRMIMNTEDTSSSTLLRVIYEGNSTTYKTYLSSSNSLRCIYKQSSSGNNFFENYRLRNEFFTGKVSEIKEKIRLRNISLNSLIESRYHDNRGKRYIHENFKWKTDVYQTVQEVNYKNCKDISKIWINRLKLRCSLKKNIASYFSSIPCLGRDIPEFYPIILYKHQRKRFICWIEEYCEEFIYGFFEINKRKKYYVYFKGKELNRREEPWQPKGRIRQSYDELFDRLDWRDMLRKRIGELERDYLIDTEKKVSLIRTFEFNDIII